MWLINKCWRGILDKFWDLCQKEVEGKKEIKRWTRVHDGVDAKEHDKRMCDGASTQKEENGYKPWGLGTFCPLL
jgi:hypothetical protein